VRGLQKWKQIWILLSKNKFNHEKSQDFTNKYDSMTLEWLFEGCAGIHVFDHELSRVFRGPVKL
jgi:hypothetical protein